MLQLSSSGFGRFGKREAVSTAIYKLDCASTLSHDLFFRESCFLSPQRFHAFFARVSLRKTMLNCYLRLDYHSVPQQNRTLQALAINTLPFSPFVASTMAELRPAPVSWTQRWFALLAVQLARAMPGRSSHSIAAGILKALHCEQERRDLYVQLSKCDAQERAHSLRSLDSCLLYCRLLGMRC